MSAYESLAAQYDGLTYDVDYGAMLDFIESILREKSKTPQTALDLACGTGSLSVLLAQRGYQVIGADLSQDMLTVAYDKAMELPDNPPYFICQPMQKLRLPQPVELVVCCLDSINYLTKPADCQETFHRVHRCLTPGGIFVFDINSEEKLRGLDGQVFLDENDDVYCVWRTEFSQEERLCYYGMDIFTHHGTNWERSFEEHREYAYSVDQLTDFLREAGFVNIRAYADRQLMPPRTGEQRIYFSAEKE